MRIGTWSGWQGRHSGSDNDENDERGNRRVLHRAGQMLAAGVVMVGLVATAIAVVSQVGVAHAADSLCGDGTRSQSGNTVTCTFSSTGREQQFSIPAGVSPLTITAVGGRGGHGGGFSIDDGGASGYGAVVTATIDTPSATTLYVEVGGNARIGSLGGGFNGGGGGGGVTTTLTGGGGGASDVRTIANDGSATSLNSRLVVAGGGGGGGMAGGSGSTPVVAGSGGNAYLNSTFPSSGANGGNGSGIMSGRGGAGATQTTAGLGGIGGSGNILGLRGSNGQLGYGGNGGVTGAGGGGAGGGYYGGGGGGGGGAINNPCCTFGGGGGGGGGSSYVEAGASGIAISLDTAGTPEVVISYTLSPAAQTTVLLAEVDSLTVDQQQSSYDTQLQAVLTDLSANNGLACSDLGAFINHVKAQSGKQMTAAQASQLIADARNIQATIGC